MTRRRCSHFAALLAVQLIFAASVQATGFSSIVVFGESTSDVGNTLLLTGSADWNPSDPLPTEPVSPLYHAGRWSNGAVWVETLAERLGLPIPAPSLAADGGTNYAYSDARFGAGTDARYSVWDGQKLGPPRVPSIGSQIGQHALSFGGIAEDQLIVVWGGGNDVIFARKERDIVAAVAAVSTHIQTLVGLGATHILVPNQFDVSKAPAFSGLPEEERTLLRAAVTGFNGLLALQLYEMQQEYGDSVTIYPVDFFTLGEQVLGPQAGCGFIDNTRPGLLVYLQALNGGVPVQLSDFNGFVFWDTVHPTEAVHDLLAAAALHTLEGKPGAVDCSTLLP